MKLRLWIVAALPLLVTTACGDDSTGTASRIADCLSSAGATIATEASELEFAVDNGSGIKSGSVGPDRSGTLNVGSYQGGSNGGWKIYYVVRKGFRVALPTLVHNPAKAAKVVAFVRPIDASATIAADSCLGQS